MTRTATPEPREETRAPIPVLLGLGEMVELFPVAKQTVYRWNTPRGAGGTALPTPDLTVSRTPMWREETVLAFAEARGIKPDAKVLRRIRKAQGHG